MEKTIQDYFNFKELFKVVKQNTIECFDTSKEYIEETCTECDNEVKSINTLYLFIKDESQIKRLLLDFEVSEEQNFNLSDEIIEISFTEDTSYSNEGGSHFGGYEYIFTIDTEMRMFKGLKIINHN